MVDSQPELDLWIPTQYSLWFPWIGAKAAELREGGRFLLVTVKQKLAAKCRHLLFSALLMRPNAPKQPSKQPF
ncbi:hypothetical protein B296_00023130 [Ensete ventricosum]|uniref:Uncharacterized protein n=1 Tax=Ensete ventricosum TaxID=4639 RepID=A0A427AGC2_ENSVE|nr:hypothetical protein B296_00023130 [Ensete ventricosum]